MPRPDDLDERLWVKVSECDCIQYLTDKGLTFPGRMGVWCDLNQKATLISKRDIVEQSSEAAIWIDGFLAGGTPSPADMFGPTMRDAESDDSRWERWRRAAAHFRREGWWQPKPWVELTPYPPAHSSSVHIWTCRAGEIWVWKGSGWTLADPQPALTNGFLTDSPCATRRCHVEERVGSTHLLCVDCGESTEVEPD